MTRPPSRPPKVVSTKEEHPQHRSRQGEEEKEKKTHIVDRSTSITDTRASRPTHPHATSIDYSTLPAMTLLDDTRMLHDRVE